MLCSYQNKVKWKMMCKRKALLDHVEAKKLIDYYVLFISASPTGGILWLYGYIQFHSSCENEDRMLRFELLR